MKIIIKPEKQNRYRIQLFCDDYQMYTHKEIMQILEKHQRLIQKDISKLLKDGFKPKEIIYH